MEKKYLTMQPFNHATIKQNSTIYPVCSIIINRNNFDFSLNIFIFLSSFSPNVIENIQPEFLW